MKQLKPIFICLAIITSSPTFAETEVSFYGGIQSSPHSTIKIGTEEYRTGWQGKSLELPPYYGFRFTKWTDKEWGWNVNFTHAKAYSSSQTRTTFSVLEFTDGANPLTVNLLRRFNKTDNGLTPYVGVGAGISLPHVELQRTGSAVKTFEYQYGGPVLSGLAGFSYPINDKYSVMTEFAVHYLMLDVKMNGESSRLKTNLITNALNIGINYKF